jgi:hypothetical protein
MKTIGRISWLILVVAIIVLAIIINTEAVKKGFENILTWFLELALISRILIGFVLWLASVIIPFIVFTYIVGEPEEGPGILFVWFFTIIWPPAWPIAIVLWILIKFVK